MKNIFGKAIAIALASIAFASCDLNLYPEASIVYDEDKGFFTNSDDVTGAHNAVYTYFRSSTGGFYNYLEDLMFDGFNATLDFGNNYGPIHSTDASFNASDQDVESFWGKFYSSMKNYNVTIDAAEAAPAEIADEARIVKGEAYAARAYSYLQLARHFGPAYDEATADTDLCVPLVLHYDQNARPARNTMKEVYDQILADLDSAFVILSISPAEENESAPNAMYFTPDAVRAMQARALLDMGEYKAAADSAIAVIESEAGYALAADKDELLKLRSEDTGSEAIMQLYASLDELPNGYGLFTSYAKDSNSSAGYSYDKPYFFPTKTLMDRYENNDLRKICWFHQTTDYPVNVQGSYYSNVYLFSKFAGNPNLNASGFANGRTASKPFMISEMYLIAAEGLLQAGDKTNAKKYLNQLQNKRKATLSAANMETIQAEWIRETVCEGLRMSCMKRWGIGFSGRAPQANTADLIQTTPKSAFEEKEMAADDRALVWPIPSYELKINKNLKQNPGYGNN